MAHKKSDDDSAAFGLGGLFKGLGDLVEKLGELTEKGEELRKEGELNLDLGDKPLKGMFGFNVRVGLGKDKDDVKVEPFGNIRQDKHTGKAVVDEIREPLVDVFEESNGVLIVAEMPGVSETDIHLALNGDILIIESHRKDRKYHKEILLPSSFEGKQPQVTCNNGVVEIQIRK